MYEKIGCIIGVLLIVGCGAQPDQTKKNQSKQEHTVRDQVSDQLPPVKDMEQPPEMASKDVKQPDKKKREKPALTKPKVSNQQALLSKLHDKSSYVRMSAITSLMKQIDEPNVTIPALLRLIDDKNEAVAQTAQAAILSMAWNPQPVLVDFYADWCGPCRMVKPVVHELEEAGHPIIQVDVDAHRDLRRKFHISSFPTFALIQGDNVITRNVGVLSKSMLLDMLKQSPKTPDKTEAIDPSLRIYGPLLALSSEDAWVRFQAVREFAQQSKTYIPQLLQLASDTNQSELIRLSAVNALGAATDGKPGSPEVISVVSELLDASKVPLDLRGTAVVFLSRHSPTPTTEVEKELINILKTSNREGLLIATAEEIGNKQIEPGLPALIDALENDSDTVRLASVTTLGEFGPKADAAVPALLAAFKELPEEEELFSDALEKICPDSKTASVELIKALGDENSELRQLALTLLGRAEYLQNAASPLLKLLNDEDPQVRAKAAHLLQKIGGYDKQIVATMTKMLDEEELDWEVRSILQDSWRHSIPELVKLVCDDKSSHQVKISAASIINNTYRKPGKVKQTALESALDNSDTITQCCAAIALSASDSKNSKLIPALVTGLKADDVALRKACINALASRPNEDLDQEMGEVRVALIKLLEDPDEEVSESAADVLRQYELSPTDWIRLVSLLKLNKQNLRYSVLTVLSEREKVPQIVVKPLTGVLRSEYLDEDIAREITGLLAKAGKPALNSLGELAFDSEVDIKMRVVAIQAIGTIAKTQSEAVSFLKKAIKQKNSRLQIAAAIGIADKVKDAKTLIPLLVLGVQSENWKIKYSASKALENVVQNSPSLVDSVISLLDNIEPDKQNDVVLELFQRRMFSPKLRKRLVQVIHDLTEEGDKYIRSKSIDYLVREGSAGTELVELLKEPDDELVHEVLRSLCSSDFEIPEKVLAQLKKTLKSSNRTTSVLAALCLLKTKSKKDALLTIVSDALKSNDEQLRREVVVGFGMLESLDAKFVPVLIELLKDRDSRSAALDKLVQMDAAAEPAIASLIELLGSVNYFSKSAGILQQLGTTAAPAIPALQAKLSNERTMIHAVMALTQIEKDHHQTIAILSRNLDNPDLRGKTCVCLGYFAEDAPTVIEPLLLKVANSEDYYDRIEAICALGSLKTKAATMQLIKVLNENKDDIEMCEPAIRSLGDIGMQPDISVPALVTALNAEDHRLRNSAAYALSNFGEAGKPAVPALQKALDDDSLARAAAVALGSIGQPATEAIPRLIKMLDDKKSRSAALAGLTEFGPLAKSAIPKLKSLESKTSGYQSRQIKMTLQAIEPVHTTKSEK